MSKQFLPASEIFRFMERWAPRHLAYDWDPIGLQVGSSSKHITKVLITLDVNLAVVQEAIKHDVDLIIAHHPLLFKPINQIDIENPKGRVLEQLIKHDITVYAAHTNLDIANGGVNDLLSDALKLESTQPLIPIHTEKLWKVAIFVPPSHVDDIREAFHQAGAGHIGEYSHCTFQTQGEGTFKPLEGSNPYIGTKHEVTYVDELKIETIVKNADLNRVINAIVHAHPYEEPAYDIYPLNNHGEIYGLGRIGTIQEEMPLKHFVQEVKSKLSLSHVRITGDLNKMIKRVAVVGGSGEKYIQAAKQKGADAYVTGDISFHHAQEAEEIGLALIDAGHYIEKIMKQATKNYLDVQLKGTAIKTIVSNTNTDPFRYI